VVADGVKPLVVLPYTLYEVMLQLAGGVTAPHVRLMALDEVAVAANPVGADGTAVQVVGDVAAPACAEAVDEPSASRASTTK